MIEVPAGRRAGLAVVLDPGVPGGVDGPRPTVLTTDRQVRRLSLGDVPGAVRAAHPGPGAEGLQRPQLDVAARPGRERARRRRRRAVRAGRRARRRRAAAAGRRRGRRRPAGARAARSTRATAAPSARTTPAGPSATTGCSGRPTRWRGGSRAARTRSPAPSTGCATCSTELGYLDGDGDATTVTPAGERLRRIYTETDLLVAECLREGVWDDLDAPSLAACVSARGVRGAPRRPPGEPARARRRVRAALAETVRVCARPRRRRGRPPAARRPPSPTRAWLGGAPLGVRVAARRRCCTDGDLAAGDFVRWCKPGASTCSTRSPPPPRRGRRAAADGAALPPEVACAAPRVPPRSRWTAASSPPSAPPAPLGDHALRVRPRGDHALRVRWCGRTQPATTVSAVTTRPRLPARPQRSARATTASWSAGVAGSVSSTAGRSASRSTRTTAGAAAR